MEVSREEEMVITAGIEGGGEERAGKGGEGRK